MQGFHHISEIAGNLTSQNQNLSVYFSHTMLSYSLAIKNAVCASSEQR